MMMRGTRRAFSITEVMIAAAILAGLILGVLNLFAVTQKQSQSSEALLNSGTLAQLVLERVKSNITQNPRWLRDLMAGAKTWTSRGTVADPTKANNPGGLTLSPFMQYLFTREAAELCQPGNQVSLGPASGGASATGIKPEELTALFESFRDFEVKVDISDDDAPLGTAISPGPEPEMLKVITVTVSRPSFTATGGKDPLAYTVTSRVATPGDSLSNASFDLLASRFDGPPLEDQWTEYMDITGTDNPYLDVTQIGEDSKHIIADAFIILARANNEMLITEGKKVVGTEIVPDPDAGTKFIDQWISELSAPGVEPLSSSRRELAKLRGRKASVIFDTFKRSRLPMEHFITSLLGPRLAPPPIKDKIASITASVKAILAQVTLVETQVTAATAAYNTASASATTVDPADPVAVKGAQDALDAAVASLNTLQNSIPTLMQSAATALQAERETIVLISLLMQFFNDPAYKDCAKRPGDYDSRFHTTLDQMAATLVLHLDQADATPYEHLAAAKLYSEVTAARQLEKDSADADGTTRLKSLASQTATKMAEHARFLAGGEVHDFVALKARNARFAARVAELKALAPRYKDVVTYFSPGGPADELLKLYDQFGLKSDLDAKSVLGALGKLIDKLKKR